MEDLNIIEQIAFGYIKVFLKNNRLSFYINTGLYLFQLLLHFSTSIPFVIHCLNKNA